MYPIRAAVKSCIYETKMTWDYKEALNNWNFTTILAGREDNNDNEKAVILAKKEFGITFPDSQPFCGLPKICELCITAKTTENSFQVWIK